MKNFRFVPTAALVVAAISVTACGDSPAKSASTEEAKPTAVVNTPSPEVVEAEVAASPETAQPVQSVETSAEQLLKRGRVVWFKCRSCHELDVDGRHKVGPNLNGIIGANAAQKEGFVYSDAMTNSGVVWDVQSLDAFIKKPSAFVKGTKMAFVGVSKESDRQAVIKYMEENAK